MQKRRGDLTWKHSTVTVKDIKKKRKLFYTGMFALLTLASIYHGIFNMLVQSEYKYFGFVIPALTYIPILLKQMKKRETKNAQ